MKSKVPLPKAHVTLDEFTELIVSALNTRLRLRVHYFAAAADGKEAC